MSGMAARIAGSDLQLQRRVDQIVFETRVHLANQFNEFADSHRRGSGELIAPEITDEEARQQVERTDAFIAAFRELIASTVVDPASPWEAACHRGFGRIGATVGGVNYVPLPN